MTQKASTAKAIDHKSNTTSSTAIKAALKSQSPLSPQEWLLQLHRQYGNKAIQRMHETGVLQARLKIGSPNDKYEQEADQITPRVQRQTEPMVEEDPKKASETLTKLDKELASTLYVSDSNVLSLLRDLTISERQTILSHYKTKIAAGVDNDTMVEILDILDADYTTRREWLKANKAKVFDINISSTFKESAGECILDKDLRTRMDDFCKYLITHLLVWRNLSMNVGCRTKRQAHRWSTAFHILIGDIPLKKLQEILPPELKDADGKQKNDKSNDEVRDEDNNVWYRRGWSREDTEANARKLYDNGKNKKPPAFEGYDVKDERRAPNIPSNSINPNRPPLSKHVFGEAMDVGTFWNSSIDGGKGDEWSDLANATVEKFFLNRPLNRSDPYGYGEDGVENWHYEKA